MLRAIAAFLIFFGGPTAAFAQARVEANVVYGMYSGLALLGDIYHPATPNGYAVVAVGGSAFSAPPSLDTTPLKENRTVTDLAKTLTSVGYLVFTVNHRAAPRFQYPAAVEDVQRAVRYLRAHASKYRINAERIGAVGDSSGGYLAGMLGTLDGKGDPVASDKLLQLSAKVQAVVAIFGAFDLRIQFKESSLKGVPEALFLGVGIRYGEKQHASASPITYVSADDPPFLLYHGDHDTTVPISHSIAMKAALENSGVPVSLITIPGGQHAVNFGFTADDKRVATVRTDIALWLDKQLKK